MSHLSWAALFVIVTAITGLFGFADVAATAAGVAATFLIAFLIILFSVVPRNDGLDSEASKRRE